MMTKRIVRVLSMALALMMLMMSTGLAEILRRGATGEEVVRLQQALTATGHYTGEIDGSYGQGTERAVKAFQDSVGLIADGKAGAATQYQLLLLTGIKVSDLANASDASGNGGSSDSATPVVKGLFGGNYHKMEYGVSGSRVRTLQKALIALGFDLPKADGVFGADTHKAVVAFQQTVGLEADGKAGPLTLKKLESYFDANGNVISGPIATTPPPANDENLEYGIPKRILRPGMSGLDVQYVQDRLKELDYYTGASDGQYGSGTEAAVRAFQENNGLTVDGKVGSKTSQVLFSSGALGSEEQMPDVPSDDRTLREGMVGDDVLSVQVRLAALGYYTGELDGVYGSGTITAMKAFQGRNKLTVDGVCGPNTLMVLFSNAAIDAGSTVQPEPDPIPTGKPTSVLRPGDESNEVKSVQNRLAELGYYAGSIDGVYGSGTTEAVRFFQARNSLTVDGKVGPKTADKLYSADAIPAYSGDSEATPTPTPTPTQQAIPTRTLRLGDTGDDVVLLQVRLMALGYLSGKADGVFGSATGAAVAAFQLRNGLTADGIAGAKTYKKLFSDSALPAQNSTPTQSPTSQPYPERNLYDGCSGEDVKDVQQRLKDLGYLNDVVDGKYGPNTELAMRAFQVKNGLTANGMGTEATYKVLFSVDAIPANGISAGGTTTETYTNLQLGSTGNAVIRLQQMLSTLKYSVNINGYFDETTYAAVIAFQKRNGLTADGIAGVQTQTKLYSGNCVTGDTELPEDTAGSGGMTGNGGGPSVSQVQLLHWYDDIKPTIKSGQVVLVYEPSTNSSFYLRFYSLGQHADSEPLTAADTATMKAAWGGKFTWAEKPVYVRLPDGRWCIASMHCMPHLSGSIKDNDFDGHLCVHFPRTMTECQKNAPKNGVRHQNDIRKHWLKITGQEIPW